MLMSFYVSQPAAHCDVYVARQTSKLNADTPVAMAGVDMRLEAGAIRFVRFTDA